MSGLLIFVFGGTAYFFGNRFLPFYFDGQGYFPFYEFLVMVAALIAFILNLVAMKKEKLLR